MGHDEPHHGLIIIPGGVCTNDGWVRGYVTFRGGCQQAGKPSFTNIREVNQSVVVLSGLWSDQVWHFPMEFLVGMAQINVSTLVHVQRPTEYVLQWLEIVGINRNQVVHGTIRANPLLVPDLGQCGTPDNTQIQWLHNVVDAVTTGHRSVVVWIRRRHSRSVRNHAEIEGILKTYASRHKLTLYVHDDKLLSTVRDQLEMFSRAVLVVGVHVSHCGTAKHPSNRVYGSR